VKLALVIAMAACSSSPRIDNRPLPEAILGTWDELCRRNSETATNCLGYDGNRQHMTLLAGGTGEQIDDHGEVKPARWTLDGTTFAMHYDILGKDMFDSMRARIVDGRLVLWYAAGGGFATIYARHGDRIDYEPTRVTTDAPTTSKIGDVGYTIALPAGYRLAADEQGRQKWSPSDGDGLEVEIFARQPHSASEPCTAKASEGGGSETFHGVEREIDVNSTLCAGAMDLHCMVTHSRGYLQPDELGPARALCRTMLVAR